ncbi:type VII secretion system-associated protein [Streptomyces sp. NPDC021093]|uniref:type VII secretion system-associated protein n=1 Tax=Streptomyces sp. NPDC021093 TaxID=3365112 RepID=UPI00378E78DE
MASPTDLSHLDIPTLRKFIDNDIESIITLLKALDEDSNQDGYRITALKYLGPQMANLEVGLSSHTLQLGKLGAEKATPIDASPLVAYLKGSSTEQGTVIKNQLKLFQDIKRNMNAVLEKMKKNQADSLTKIKSQEFLNDLRDVDGDLAPQKP